LLDKFPQNHRFYTHMPKRVRTHVNPLAITETHHFEGFGNDRPIFVDVGAFKGEFMAELIKKFPDHNFILFEIRLPIAEKLREKFIGQDNVVVFHGDAGLNFKNILQPCLDQGATIKEIFVNFPDPWFKDKHKKRRFITTKFLNQCAPWLPAETEFIFQTDQEFLFQETKEYLIETPYKITEEFNKPPYGLQTNWEVVKVAEGKDIFRMRFSAYE